MYDVLGACITDLDSAIRMLWIAKGLNKEKRVFNTTIVTIRPSKYDLLMFELRSHKVGTPMNGDIYAHASQRYDNCIYFSYPLSAYIERGK